MDYYDGHYKYGVFDPLMVLKITHMTNNHATTTTSAMVTHDIKKQLNAEYWTCNASENVVKSLIITFMYDDCAIAYFTYKLQTLTMLMAPPQKYLKQIWYEWMLDSVTHWMSKQPEDE